MSSSALRAGGVVMYRAYACENRPVAHPNPRLGYLLIVLAAVLFGLNGGVSRVAMGAGLSPESFTTLRVTGATLVFVVYALTFRRRALVRPRGTAFLLVKHSDWSASPVCN